VEDVVARIVMAVAKVDTNVCLGDVVYVHTVKKLIRP